MLKLFLTLALVASVFLQESRAEEAEASCFPPIPKCKKNEVWEICPPKCPFRTCGLDDNLIDCIPSPTPGDPDCPPPRCRCKPQFFRDDKNNCVPWDKCPKCTKPNEQYDPCDSPCPARRCDFNPAVALCMRPPEIGDKECVVGCRCSDGFLRNDKGVCVPRDQCPKKCYKENEFYDPCPGCDPQTCSTIGEKFECGLIPADKNDPKCKGACRCMDGYARDNNGDCVPKEWCSKCNGPNEVYDKCPDCHPQTCETKDRVYKCVVPPKGGCKPACRCQRGFFRNKIGECISAENCAKCPGDHEYWSCGGACDNVCGDPNTQDKCPIINVKCNEMCYCEKGYARALNETCIPKEDCDDECPKNEVINVCPENLCAPKKCSEAGFPLDCNDSKPCVRACICKPDYLRNSKGVCIPTKQCPSCGGDKNATSGCGTNCSKQCSDLLSSREPIPCLPMCYPNGCECRKDYYYDKNTKKCVLAKDCTPSCKENEVFSTCINGGCQKKLCSDLNKPDVCVHPKICKVGCLCAKGYLRNKKGDCVPINQCDVCPKNERYEECPATLCGPQTCSEAGFPKDCIIRNEGEPCPGKPGCVCADGFLRDCNGVCIPSKDCPSCGGDKNSTLGCGVCGKTCSNYKSEDPILCILICRINTCDCRPDYVFDGNTKKCVLPEDCTPVCKKHEEYSKCVNNGDRRNCSDPDKPKKCNPKDCKDGCVCVKGYLRDKGGVCVPIDQCNKCS